MAGNVEEWTRTLWGKEGFEKPSFKYPYRPDDRREDLIAGDEVLRVLRGGSWDNDRDSARCAFRFRINPNVSGSVFGFRVVSPI
jgi:formylglycine-generating enzyme required for sulfatase activity